MGKINLQHLTFFNRDKKLLNLNHRIVLKLRGKLVKQRNHPLKLFVRRLKKHASFAGFEPGLAYPEGKGDEADNPVVNLPVVAFQLGDITVADKNGLGKLRLGQSEGFSYLFDAFVDGHASKYKGKNLTFQGMFLQNEY
jgi:hypothetical protein